MWDVGLVKQEAKRALRRYYWMAFVVCLCTSFVGNIHTSLGKVFNVSFDLPIYRNPQELFTVFTILGVALLLGVVFSLGMRFFLVNPVYVGRNRFFMESRYRESRFERLFFGFTQGQKRYLNLVKVMAIQDVYIYSWSVPGVALLIIGGLYKGLGETYAGATLLALGGVLSLLSAIPLAIQYYTYSMVPYLLTESPDLDWRRVLRLSKQMTQGERAKLFLLDLSFIGWMILGFLACCIGLCFVEPYYQATKAEVYAALREKAAALGLAAPEELPGFGS